MGDDYRLSAVPVVKVANGASPATLPIEQPTQFPMTINLRTAAALGIRIPSELLLRADMTSNRFDCRSVPTTPPLTASL